MICLVGILPIEALGEVEAARLEALETAFEGWKQAAAGGDSLALREAEEGVRAALVELDLPESEPLSAVAILEARRRLEAGAPGADRVAAFAVELAPSFPPAHFTLARARFRTAPLSVGAWAGPLLEGLASYRLSPRHGRPLLANVSLGLVFSALLAGFAGILLGLLRHLRRLAHDLRHLLPGKPPAVLAAAAVLGAFLLLALFFGGPLLWFGFAALGLSFYFGTQERWVFALFLVGAGQLALLLPWLEKETAWADSTAALLDAVDARGDLSRLPELRALAAGEEAPPEALFALARYEKRVGNLEEAAELYDRVLRRRPAWPAALVNRANLDFIGGDLARAEERYQRATELDPTLAEAWFGLSRVHYRQVEIARGQEARERALELRPELAERYNAGEEEAHRTHRYLVDVGLPRADLLSVASPSGRLHPSLVRHLWGPVPESGVPVAGGVLGLLVLLLPLAGLRTSRGCAQCGEPICLRCERSAEGSENCGACQQLVSRQRGLDPAVRNRKEVEIARYARRKRFVVRAASLLALGPFLQGRTLWGFLLLTLVGAAAINLRGILPPLFGGWPLGLRAAFLLPLLGAILLSVWVSGREEA